MSDFILGFDFGKKFIGIAVGQLITKTAKPLKTIITKNGTPNWQQIADIIHEWRPALLVVGLPLNMNGTEQKITNLAKQFAEQLETRFHLPAKFFDERLSTVEAKAQLFEKGGYRALDKTSIDAVSAQLILEGFMQSHERK